jgi:hypothetical protein
MTPLHDAVMTFLMHKGVAGATATRGYSGCGGHQTLRRPKIEALAEHLPIRIEARQRRENQAVKAGSAEGAEGLGWRHRLSGEVGADCRVPRQRRPNGVL